MNTAHRLKSFTQKILNSKKTFVENNTTKNILYYDTLKDIFECDDVFCVYECLNSVNKECKKLEKQTVKLNVYDPSKEAINILKDISSPLNVAIPVDNVHKKLSPSVLHSLYFISSIMEAEPDEGDKEIMYSNKAIYCEDDIDLSEFSSSIEQLIDTIMSSELDDNTKKIFIEFLYDLKKGVKLYSINGIEALLDAVAKNICKYKLIEASIPSKYDDFKKRVSALIGEVMFWAETAKSARKSYKALKQAVAGTIEVKEDE